MSNLICCVKNGLSFCSVSFALSKFKQLKFMDKSVRHVLPRLMMSKVTEFVRTSQNVVDINKSFEPPQSDGSDQVNVVCDKDDCYPSRADRNWKDKGKSFKQAPNYFVSIKISSKQVNNTSAHCC